MQMRKLSLWTAYCEEWNSGKQELWQTRNRAPKQSSLGFCSSVPWTSSRHPCQETLVAFEHCFHYRARWWNLANKASLCQAAFQYLKARKPIIRQLEYATMQGWDCIMLCRIMSTLEFCTNSLHLFGITEHECLSYAWPLRSVAFSKKGTTAPFCYMHAGWHQAAWISHSVVRNKMIDRKWSEVPRNRIWWLRFPWLCSSLWQQCVQIKQSKLQKVFCVLCIYY